MKDIRKDLRERIKDTRTQQEHLQFRIKELDKKATMLESLLKQEESEWKARQPSLLELGERVPVKTHTELSRFLLTSLSDGNPHGTDELVALAQTKGIRIKGKFPRRAVHFALVGMKQNNLVEMVRSRVWKIAGKGGGKVEP